MGFIGKLLSFGNTTKHGAKASNAVVDPGGGASKTITHFTDPGDDSQPLPGDYVACVKIPRSGNAVATGYVDPANAQKAGPGEKRIYARGGAGASVVEVWLKADGTALIQNALGSIELMPNGTTVITSPGASLTVFAAGSIVGSNPAGGYELKANGDYEVDNGSGNFKLLASGTFDANGVTIDPSGNVVVPGGGSISSPSILVDSKELKDHVHNGVTTGGGDTGPNQ